MKSSTNQSFNRGDDGAKPKSQRGDPSVDNHDRQCGAFKKQPFPNHQQGPLQTYRVDDNFTVLKLSIHDVFKAIKSQLWVKRMKAKPRNPAHLRVRLLLPL